MSQGYNFDKSSVDRIAAAVRKTEGQPPIINRRGSPDGAPVWANFCMPSTKIVAGTTNGAGSGTGTLYTMGSTGDFVTTSVGSTFYNVGSAIATTNMFHLVHREPIEGKWVINATAPGTEIKWGKVERNWIDSVTAYVRVNECDDYSGTSPVAGITNVLLPRTQNRDPNLITDDVIAYSITADGSYVCVSDYQDDAFGTIKMQDSTLAQEGWEVYSDMTDRFPVGANAGKYAAGSAGGSTSHNHDQVGTDGGGTPGSQFTDRSNLPPYRAVGFVIRVDNSVSAP